MRLRLIALAAAAFSLFACGHTDRTETPRIVVSPSSLVFNSVPIGGRDTLDLLVENEGGATLRVSQIRIDTTTSFVALTDAPETGFSLEPGDSRYVQFAYEPTSPEDTDGEVVFVTNDPANAELVIPIDTPRPIPVPVMIPAAFDFGVVGVNATETLDIELRNVGFAPLIVCDIFLGSHPEFSSDIQDVLRTVESPIHLPVVDLYDFDSGVGVDTLEFELRYSPQAPGDDATILTLMYDEVGDLDHACADNPVRTVTYDVVGNAGTAVLDRFPCPLDFGERAVDVTHNEAITLENLGEIPLQIYEISLDENATAASFSLGAVPDLPTTLESEEATAFSVEYRPVDFAAESGVVVIEHDDANGDRIASECRLTGVGVENVCPVASPIGWIQEDAENRRGTTIDWALPLQTLILDGTASYDPTGDPLTDYIWEIEEAPEAAINGIRPYSGEPDNPALAEYFLPLAGQYRICLHVVDSSGLDCEAACISVVAIPEEAIAIELTWDNPTDPDQTDAEGSDVDLHVVKMPAAWGDPVYDTFYANKAPFWDPENPSLDIDDTDGVGPETIQMDDPDDCTWYAVGVHYFREAFGTAWPTVRIYIDGRLVDEVVNQPLFETDEFWDVARIHWPSRTIYRVNEVIEGYENGAGFAPPVTDAMRASGLCGVPGS